MLFRPGTANTAKQLLQNSLMKSMNSHRCHARPLLCFKTKICSKSNDTFVWMGSDKFYKLKDIDYVHMTAMANKVKVKKYQSDDVQLEVPWKSVGVFIMGELNRHRVEIDLHQVRGKAVVLEGNVIASYPMEWLVK